MIPIYHMASLARSGETLLLRSLEAHSKLVVPFNIADKIGSRSEELLYEFFRTFEPTEVDIAEPALKYLNLKEDSKLIVKQGIWEHQYPFNGFALIRNPASVWASMLTYGITGKKNIQQLQAHWLHHRLNRFKAWAEAMNANVSDRMLPIQMFTHFYSKRINHLLSLGLPIIYYEDFVRNPEQNMRRICDILEVEFEPETITSHNKYSNGSVGHGFIQLNRPIDESSIYKFKQILPKEDFNYIVENTPTPGYSMSWDVIRTCDGKTRSI